ncbi:KDO2-lipid IV(A) lauroyltransferase [Pseudoxanthomonas japonensis]|jgi:KDO2-lipid IV(A) lauroyltransferase|uniref:LpxL/LpxP family Kdo(2)-lipid IV(A) lauroyl/palmitoleoyl acyltransferase n=1 Tax=Pseudoxanthomonas japonensis TaxID=69284 RepID=UPI001D431DEB|nr:LpxL/LpxP family Kdo(2)-lipid IV(A) lauroyl/palmitoleoyl acyltransferase [Pseudoxanthomonas japonensis]MBA3928189.1 lipid A biosynthesis lauroyl acyltransferase [Xanthomonas sp.]MDR7068216.1 KDO2-lipid IV(A) lauroyltransferase [Pseudoxanthomonas japonensis]
MAESEKKPSAAGERLPLGPRQWPAWIGIGLAWLVARLPWTLQRWLGRLIGALFFMAMRERREIARRNIALCFPARSSAEQDALARASFAELGIGLFEFARAWWGSVDPMRKGLQVEGLEHLAAARAGGRGVIVVSGHFTTLEMSARLMCDYAPLAGMYRPHNQGAMEWAVKRGRLRYATAMFTRDELRPALKHLKQGGLLWFAPDQDTRRGESVFVPFFGHPAYSLTSTHQLARLSGAAVIAFSHVRRDDGGYTLTLSPALEDFPSSDATTDTARVIAAIEAMVRAAPTQYLWIHRRFKRQPDGRGELYR